MTAPSSRREPIDPERLSKLLGPGWGELVVTAATASTNSDLVAAAKVGAGNWSVHTTDHQEAGRGRLDRTFTMPPGAGLAVSLLVHASEVQPKHWPWLPLLVGVAVSEVTEKFGVASALKWPNDVLTHSEKKLAGILAERVETPTGAAAVVGVGLNVSLRAEELPVVTATSLELEGAAELDRTVLAAAVAERIRFWAENWLAGEIEPIARAYRERSLTLGGSVRLVRPNQPDVEGVVEAIDELGRIVINGTAWSAGDIIHAKRLTKTLDTQNL